jgi:hypothetical protein
MMSTKTTAVVGERNAARDAVVAAFDKAYKFAEADENYGTEAATDAQNAAFDAAKAAGWDWEADQQFCDWCLKATDLEIITEGKKRFLKSDDNGGVSLWMDEHPKANVPAVIWQHPELVDVSWHNDTMPSFNPKGWEECGGDSGNVDLRLWVDYEDQTDSEFPDDPDWTRYHVEWNDDGDYVTIYRGFDALAAIEALLAAKKRRSAAPASSVGH